MGMSHQIYDALPSDEERFALLDRAFERGAIFWATSDLYGDNEELLVNWFKRTGKRDQIFLATKFGYVKGIKTLEVDSSAAYCKKACAESLRLLGIDCIDLYYPHLLNPETPIEETMRAMVELQAEGKIKNIGLSTISSNIDVVAWFEALAEKRGCTPSQLALAWLMKQGPDIFHILGTKRINYLEENWGALYVFLTDKEEAEIRAFAEASEFARNPVPDQYMSTVFQDTKEESSQV